MTFSSKHPVRSKWNLILVFWVISLSGINSHSNLLAQDIVSYNEGHSGFELAFSAALLPLNGGSNLNGWAGLNGITDQGLGFSFGGIFYQRLKKKDNKYYDFGISLGYTKMGEIDPSQDDLDNFYTLGAFEIGVALRNPLWGLNNPAIIQSVSLIAVSPSFAQFQDTNISTSIGTGIGVRARLGYQKPVSDEQAVTFFVEGQYTNDISSAETDFYSIGAGVQFNLLIQK